MRCCRRTAKGFWASMSKSLAIIPSSRMPANPTPPDADTNSRLTRLCRHYRSLPIATNYNWAKSGVNTDLCFLTCLSARLYVKFWPLATQFPGRRKPCRFPVLRGSPKSRALWAAPGPPQSRTARQAVYLDQSRQPITVKVVSCPANEAEARRCRLG